jgi:hypothetical protein
MIELAYALLSSTAGEALLNDVPPHRPPMSVARL